MTEKSFEGNLRHLGTEHTKSASWAEARLSELPEFFADMSKDEEARWQELKKIKAIEQDLKDNPLRPKGIKQNLALEAGDVQALQKTEVGLWALLGWAVRDQLVLDAYASERSGAPVVAKKSGDIPDFGEAGVSLGGCGGEVAVHDDAMSVLLAVYEALDYKAACEIFDFVKADLLPDFVSALPTRRVVPLLRGAHKSDDLSGLSDLDYWDYLNEVAPSGDWAALSAQDVLTVRCKQLHKVNGWCVRFVGASEAEILADSLRLSERYDVFYSHLAVVYEKLSTVGLRRYRLCGIGVSATPWLENGV